MSDIWTERTDIGVTTSYYGFAPFGTDTSEAGWQIKRITRSGSDAVEAWSGDRPNAVWDNRASISYT